MPYVPVDPALAQRLRDDAQSRRAASGAEGWKPKIGPIGHPARNFIRIMPSHPNMRGMWVLYQRIHYRLGPSRDHSAVCIETETTPCPGCEYSEWLLDLASKETDGRKAAEYRALAEGFSGVDAKDRYTIALVDLEHPEIGVQRWSFNDPVFRKLDGCFLDDRKQWRDITDPAGQTGRGVIIDAVKKPGQRGGQEFTDYEMRAMEQVEPIADAR